MKLTAELALKVLENFRGKTKSDKWVNHSICVGASAGKIAKALVKKGIAVDIDKTITLGYLHDIGKYNGESHGAVARAIQFYFEKMPEDGMLLKVSGQKNCEIKEYKI